MTDDEIKQATLDVLSKVAPEVNVDAISPDINFRDQFDFDSMDFLNFAIGLGKHLDFEIPEVDYPKLSNLNGCVVYLAAMLRTNEHL